MKKVGFVLLAVFLLLSCQQKAPEQQSLSYDQALEKSRGTTVNFYMWGGSATINKWINSYVTNRLKEVYDLTLNMVPMDASVFVNKLLTEKQAGKKNGTVDVMWINGENFKNAREAGLLYGPVADKLPNFNKYVDPATVAFDFGFPVENYEMPYGRAQFVFIHDSAKIISPPESFAALKQWIINHPGKFTYPQPPDFTGSAFIRQLFYATTGGHEQYMKGFDEKLYLEKSPQLWAYLTEIKPYLWQKGEVYPKDIAALGLLFERGEVDMNMSYHQAYASGKIIEGKYPHSVRTFVMKEGAIYNTHFTAIAHNAPNLAGAMVLADFLMSPEAQLSKNAPENWGDFTVLDMEKLEGSIQQAFGALDLGKATLPLDVLNRHGVPEIPAAYLTRLENDWARFVLEKK
ncbi:putative spermidine/putrescine transport system substrate-binding protein [Desulfocicer vacuolatum DSM 3385]|uniref:Putative spermidine/putrescine transport system substrate-binding protein n=1 Tax=Desulfocicer vacuolatum DSM 3385 TaxID=1121400 RepID=A0A1W2B6N9_9BACT|nr:ABC transporter substrate-binding protein [Desulfocicer vacuolatum]SMC68514.1 putative spermidine/putrescine transport system substrate-binding protein [Desulfocicer vacuolatum DSM 3385]